MKPIPTISDHSRYSRAFLGQGIYGKEYEDRCADMEVGSAALFDAIKQAHVSAGRWRCV